MNEPNLSQERAIRHNTGPMLVTAGPGSGKTFVITKRILNLIEEYHVPPEEILVITFTKAAALEMQKRFREFSSDSFYPVTFGTFHAAFYQIIQTSSPNRGTLISDYDKKKLFHGIMKQEDYKRSGSISNGNHYGEYEEQEALNQELLKEFSAYKRMVDKRDFHSTYVDDVEFLRLYRLYCDEMRGRNLIDFDDMILMCYELLRDNKEAREYWQKRFRYFLVDEFQDISPMQYEVLTLLCGSDHNLFAVGDDDQSIYAFRGAEPENMFRFLEDYKEAQLVNLARNYRCPKNVVELADSFIQRNKKRIPKEICPAKEEEGEVIMITCSSSREKYERVCREILCMKERGIPYPEIALLFRTNEISPILLKELKRHRIPFRIKEKIRMLTDHFITRDVIAYMELASGKRTRRNLFTVMNRPNRYIPRSILDRDIFTFSELKRRAAGKRYLWDNLNELERNLERLAGMDSLQAITYLRKGMGYEDFLMKNAYENGVAYQVYQEVLDEVTFFAREYRNMEEWLEVMKEAEHIPDSANGEEGVRLMTMHRAKGLEWDAVLIPDFEEGMIPHKRARKEKQLEEERRLFYVAMTRAKKSLLIFTYKESRELLKRPSPFLKELDFLLTNTP